MSISVIFDDNTGGHDIEEASQGARQLGLVIALHGRRSFYRQSRYKMVHFVVVQQLRGEANALLPPAGLSSNHRGAASPGRRVFAYKVQGKAAVADKEEVVNRVALGLPE